MYNYVLLVDGRDKGKGIVLPCFVGHSIVTYLVYIISKESSPFSVTVNYYIFIQFVNTICM